MPRQKRKRIVKVTVTVNWDLDDEYPVTSEDEARKIFFEQAQDFGEWNFEWSE